MLALLLPSAVPARLAMRQPALVIHAPYPNPRHHATAAEPEATLALRETALVLCEEGFAARAGSESSVGFGFCIAVDSGVAGGVLVACLV